MTHTEAGRIPAGRPLRVAFFGSPAFALPSLQALVDAGHTVAAVYAQPPRPAGRGHKEQRAPVHVLAETLGLPVRTPFTLRDEAEQRAFAALALDAAVVAAYGLILPKAILQAPKLGCINVHASLLPRWRGAAPIERAIMAGDAETGVTLMQMDEGLDTGPMLQTCRVAIGPATTAAELRETLAGLGASLLPEALAGLAAGALGARPQPADGVTYAHKLARDEGRTDWSLPAAVLERRVRALTPQPGAFFEHRGERIKLLAAEVADAAGQAAQPGPALDDRLTIACGDGALLPTILQRPGRGRAGTAAFLRGYPLPAGTRLG